MTDQSSGSVLSDLATGDRPIPPRGVGDYSPPEVEIVTRGEADNTSVKLNGKPLATTDRVSSSVISKLDGSVVVNVVIWGSVDV